MELKNALVEALKEFFRLTILSVIPLLVDGLTSGTIDWRLVGVTAAIAGLRFIDKLLHEYGKETENDGLTKGLTRF